MATFKVLDVVIITFTQPLSNSTARAHHAQVLKFNNMYKCMPRGGMHKQASSIGTCTNGHDWPWRAEPHPACRPQLQLHANGPVLIRMHNNVCLN